MVRRLFKVVAILAVLVGILWSGLWFAASYVVAGALEKPRSLSGIAAGCAQSSVGGFPLRFEIGCNGLTLDDRSRGLSLRLPGLTATGVLLPPGRFLANARGPVQVRAGDLQLTAEAGWANASARADVGLSGLSGFASILETGRLVVDSAVGLLPIHVVEFRRAEIELRPSAAAGGSLNLIANIDTLHVERPNGKTLPDVNAVIDVTAVGVGGSIGIEPALQLARWISDQGGQLQIDRVEIRTGALALRVGGTLTMASTGLLSGKIGLRLLGLNALQEIGEALAPGSSEFLGRLSAAFRQLTKPVNTPDGPAQELELTVRNGAVFYGILPLVYPEGGRLVQLVIPRLSLGGN